MLFGASALYAAACAVRIFRRRVRKWRLAPPAARQFARIVRVPACLEQKVTKATKECTEQSITAGAGPAFRLLRLLLFQIPGGNGGRAANFIFLPQMFLPVRYARTWLRRQLGRKIEGKKMGDGAEQPRISRTARMQKQRPALLPALIRGIGVIRGSSGVLGDLAAKAAKEGVRRAGGFPGNDCPGCDWAKESGNSGQITPPGIDKYESCVYSEHVARL